MGAAFFLILLVPLHVWVANAVERMTFGVLPQWTSEGLGRLFAVLVFTVPGLVVAAIIASRGPSDTETRCRKCGYILRGIIEPRCPECGEPI
jgi:hypothetical protein